MYVFDVDTGALTRLGDTGPVAIGGDRVLLAQGMSVRIVDIGGALHGGYTLPPAAPLLPGTTATGPESITRLEAAPDGSAVVLSFVPIQTSRGDPASSGMGRIVGPGGEVRRIDVPSSDFEWSDDGRTIAFALHNQLQLLDAAGRPLRTLPTTFLSDIRWSPDSRSIAGSSNGAAVRVDAATGAAETLAGLRQGPDLGPGGAVAGLAEQTGSTWWQPVVLHPSGSTTVLSTWPNAGGVTWSDNGTRLAFVQSTAPPGSIGHGSVDDFLQIVDSAGTPVRRVLPTAALTVQRGGATSAGEPTWIGDRYLVFAVVSG